MKRIATLSVTLLALAVISFSAAHAAALTGIVTDSSTSSPLQGVTVRAVASEDMTRPYLTQTGKDGRFILKNLPPGLYTARFSHVGFVAATLDSLVLSEKDTVSVRVALIPTVVDVNAITISTSRRPEKVVDAPASVAILDSTSVASRTSLSTADHVKSMPSVDAVATGINSSSVVVRGFNNVFSTTLLSMIDNRMTHVPSLRVNAYQFVPIVNEDIERMELVLGPGAALYGPNCTDGVLHIITKSPFASPGTTISFAGGERELALGSFRSAVVFNDKLAGRISGQYYRAIDWKTDDPAEPDSVILYEQTPDGNVYEDHWTDNQRDFKVDKLSIDARLDWAASDELLLITNGGFNRASNIELTDLGAAQVNDWTYSYAQTRLMYKDLFAQAFVNMSDAGDTYLRRSGAKIVDNSKFYSAQIQHQLHLGERQSFTYGFDMYLTRPSTMSTLHGRNEMDDRINELGLYLQSESQVTSKLRFTAAGRFDHHNQLVSPIFSPRAALSYQPNPLHNLRLTYNRAYATPGSPNLFLDILSASVPTDDPALEAIIGPTIMNVRGMGSANGFTFLYSEDGRAEMVSLYGDLLADMGYVSTPNSYIPANVNSVWPAMRALAVAQDPTLDAVLPASLSSPVPGQYAVLDPLTGLHQTLEPSSIIDVEPARERRTTTFEIGYKGLVLKKLSAGVDVYYSRMHDFIGPMMVETPHVFIDSAAFVGTLRSDIIDGGAVDSAAADAVANSMYGEYAELPIGLVSPQEIQNATDVVMTYRNFGEVDLVGADVSICYHLSEHWNASAIYSYLSKNIYRNLDNVADLSVNAPKHKFGGCLEYLEPSYRLRSRLRFRFVDSYPVNSGVYIGEVDRFTIFDLDVTYGLTDRTRLTLNVQNLLDTKHAEFVGAPELGRQAILRVSHSLSKHH